ncbi:MAG: hypothetical protein R2940_12405 [Syntrophotaleaceae bacterium]
MNNEIRSLRLRVKKLESENQQLKKRIEELYDEADDAQGVITMYSGMVADLFSQIEGFVNVAHRSKKRNRQPGPLGVEIINFLQKTYGKRESMPALSTLFELFMQHVQGLCEQGHAHFLDLEEKDSEEKDNKFDLYLHGSDTPIKADTIYKKLSRYVKQLQKEGLLPPSRR